MAGRHCLRGAQDVSREKLGRKRLMRRRKTGIMKGLTGTGRVRKKFKKTVANFRQGDAKPRRCGKGDPGGIWDPVKQFHRRHTFRSNVLEVRKVGGKHEGRDTPKKMRRI